MSLYTLIIVTFIVFMAINVIIGLRGRKHASTTKDFLTASGQSGIWFIIASAVGASIGSGVVIGTTQYAVKLGVAGAWYAIACGIACVVHAFVMTRFIYRNKLVSFSDYFKRRYDSNFIVLLYSGIGPFACAASMGGQLVAAKAIFQAFGIDPTIGLVITAAVMLVYTMFAGLWGSYATAVFQVGVIIVGVLVVGISMFTQGGIAEIHAFYPAEKFDLFNISPELWMMFVGPMVLSVLVDQTSVQRAASAKTEATAFWGHLLSCIPLFLFGWLMVYIGMWSGAEFPDAGGNAFIVMLMNKVSPIVCAVMICAILAAIMSTASGALVATDALVVHDLYCGFINKNATEEQQKRLIDRIVNQQKNWKFSMSDINERQYWDRYQELYEEMISKTSKDISPWFIIPADQKWYTRYIVALITLQALKKIDPQFPKLDPEVQKQLETFKKLIAQVDVKELAEIQTTLSEKASKENKEN